MRPVSLLVACVLGITASGCSSNDIILKKQTEMDARMEQIIQANAASAAQLAGLSTAVRELREQVAAHGHDLEEMKPALRELKAPPAAAGQRVGEKPDQPADSRIVLVGKEGAPGEGDVSGQDAYMKAFGLFSANNYGEAIAAFEAFIRSHPGSEYAGNAQYWIGECYYTQRDYKRSLEAFKKVLDNYPNGKKTPDALLKVGYSLISLNDHQKARTVLETLVEKYPKSPAAAKARERLSR